MSKQGDYASDSDQSDEDFCPDKAINSDAPSEEESDDPISANEDESVSNKKSKTKKTNKNQAKVTESPSEKERIVTRNREEVGTKSSIEKHELESDEEDSGRKEALWADFLSDVSTPAPSKADKPASSKRKEVKTVDEDKGNSIEKKKTPDSPKEPEKVVVTEIFDFAGEEVRVEKTVSADRLKENGSKKSVTPSSATSSAHGSTKRPAVGGLGSILGQIGKKKKITVLEKTKLDWDSFKTTEGIEEELQTFNKGKDGYLQKQDFLERTDLRQFEIEKNIRQSRRKPM